MTDFHGVADGAVAPLVAVVGPPNSGKTTLFNKLTGLRQKVANYPGVTVEKYLGVVDLGGGSRVDLVDLPGVHGLSARTLDERVTVDVLKGRVAGMRPLDAVIVIVDSTSLEPDLMLLEPLSAFGLPTLLVLNMADEFEARGGSVDTEVLSVEFGIETCRTNARSGEGFDRIRDFLAGVKIRTGALGHPLIGGGLQAGGRLPTVDALVARRASIRRVLADAHYVAPGPSGWTARLDAVFLNRYLGPLAFFLVAALVFQAIFTWAVPAMDLVEALVAWSGEGLRAVLPVGWMRSLVVDGIWAGVGAVIVFLPQILVLFLFLGILEDSGYLARAAVIADRLMYRVGLQGRAFLPLLSGYACAVPAILAARAVEDERDRLATIFVTPFMTCSARLPVYALLIAAFVPAQPVLGPFLGSQAVALLGLYALGVIAAVGTAFILRKTLLRAPHASFVMELPPYRWPTARSLGVRLWDRSKVFLRRAGRVILAVTVILWIMTQFPRVDGAPPAFEESVLARSGKLIEPAIAPLGFDWRIGVGLVSSLAAREVIVGTMGTIYGIENAEQEGSLELQAALQSHFDLPTAAALLVFFAFALQCMSTVAVMRRETNGWKWPALQFFYMLTLAYVGAFVAYRVF
ncbi:MAG: ferrous iron transporter B [Gemmatimonadetes bacterium]|nr:ferrous iron transporter B [Gemmatimonadota bacterium]